MTYMLAFIVCLTLLRLFERAMEKSVAPFDPFDKITDYRRHFDRQPRDETIAKDITPREYDPVAREQLRRSQERRRLSNPDTGQRRRRTDRSE